jgi:hypothetical protein
MTAPIVQQHDSKAGSLASLVALVEKERLPLTLHRHRHLPHRKRVTRVRTAFIDKHCESGFRIPWRSN